MHALKIVGHLVIGVAIAYVLMTLAPLLVG